MEWHHIFPEIGMLWKGKRKIRVSVTVMGVMEAEVVVVVMLRLVAINRKTKISCFKFCACIRMYVYY
jgi:hypothetical protein